MSIQSLTENPPQVIRSPWRDFLHAFVRNPLALVSGGFVLLLMWWWRSLRPGWPLGSDGTRLDGVVVTAQRGTLDGNRRAGA